MKKLIFLILVTVFSSCEKFLDVTPFEGGLVKFNSANQYDALLNNIFLTRNRVEWQTAILASDDCHFDPIWQDFSSPSNLQTVQQWEGVNSWNEEITKSIGGGGGGFIPFISTYNSNMYEINLIINEIDNASVAGDKTKKEQVKAEAKFWRAFFHFTLLVEYCMHPSLNGGNSLGLGYRNSISAEKTGVEDRQTVKFTLDNVIKDLEEAKKAMTEINHNVFNVSQPWRVTLPTVEALLARVYMYTGDYTKAFASAKSAYAAYNFLYNLNDQTLFSNRNLTPAQTETFNGINYSVTRTHPAIALDQSSTSPTSNSNYWYKEAYFRVVSQFGAFIKMPPSEALYKSYSAEDLRKKVYYDNNQNIVVGSFLPPRFKDQYFAHTYFKNNASTTQGGYLLGVTVPEIILTMAECRARNIGDGPSAAELLKTLRSKRFPTNFVDNIGGSLREVKEERRRELAFVMRWYDVKRYNALDNDNIVIEKRARVNPFSINSDIATFSLAPNTPATALQLPQSELALLGWAQNPYSGVTKK